MITAFNTYRFFPMILAEKLRFEKNGWEMRDMGWQIIRWIDGQIEEQTYIRADLSYKVAALHL